jgi:hypothetical protein
MVLIPEDQEPATEGTEDREKERQKQFTGWAGCTGFKTGGNDLRSIV